MKISELRKSFFEGDIEKHKYIKDIYNDFHSILFQYPELLKDSNVKSLNIDKDGVKLITKQDVSLVWAPGDSRIAPPGILNFMDYEPEETSLIKALAREKKIFYDIGANIGWYTINVAKSIEGIHIHAFEPIPQTYQYLNINVSDNNINNVSLWNFGLSDEVGNFDFFFYPEGSGNASLRNLSKRDSVIKIKCELKTIDDFRQSQNEPIDFIKIDTEGSELLALKGGINSLKHDKPIIFSEILRKWSKEFDYSANDILIFLENIGYSSYVINNGKLEEVYIIDDSTTHTNFVFLHRDKHLNEFKELIS